MRRLKQYSLYYIFNTEDKTVKCFGTNDTSVQEGTYTGDFENGVDIYWPKEDYHEGFRHKDGSKKAYWIDADNVEWDYEVCEVSEAQRVLDSLK